MSIRHSIGDGILTITIKGKHPVQEALAGYVSAFSDPKFISGTKLLVDASQYRGNRTSQELRQIAKHIADQTCASSIAFVASKDFWFSIYRVLEHFVTENGVIKPMDVFRSKVNAIRWLDTRA
jgi:hypothetical protein